MKRVKKQLESRLYTEVPAGRFHPVVWSGVYAPVYTACEWAWQITGEMTISKERFFRNFSKKV